MTGNSPQKNTLLTYEEIYHRLEQQADTVKLKRRGSEIPLSIMRVVDGYNPDTEYLMMLANVKEYPEDRFNSGIYVEVKKAYLLTNQKGLSEAERPNILVKICQSGSRNGQYEIDANRRRGFLYATQERNSKLYVFMFMLGHIPYAHLFKSPDISIDEKYILLIQGLLEVNTCTSLSIAQNDSHHHNLRQDLVTKKAYLIDYDLATDLSLNSETHMNYLAVVTCLRWAYPQLLDSLAEELQRFINAIDVFSKNGSKTAKECLTLFKSCYPSHYNEAQRRQMLDDDSSAKKIMGI